MNWRASSIGCDELTFTWRDLLRLAWSGVLQQYGVPIVIRRRGW